MFKCTRSFAYANDAKIVRSSDAQCNTEESPYVALASSNKVLFDNEQRISFKMK